MNGMRPLLLALALVGANPAHSQDAANFPSKPIHVIVPFTAGSATDVVARLVGERLNNAWGQPVVVENRAGAGGTIGIAQTAKSEPDGYTLAVVSTGHVVNHVLYKDLQYDTLKDLAGVAPLVSLPSVLVVSPALGIKSARDLVAAAKAKPGEFNYGTAGVGSAAHINSEKFNVAAGIKGLHVPLKGTPPILTETMGGRLHYAWVPSVSSMGLLKEGRLVALAVSTPTRVAALPDVPTIAEAGYPGGEFIFWVGALTPSKTPREIVAKLNAEINRALRSADMRERLEKLGGEPMSMNAAQFDSFIRQEYDVLGKVMRNAGAVPQ
jgi:tripartite-type tricarboxylate transporter receptor subunit TctC